MVLSILQSQKRYRRQAPRSVCANKPLTCHILPDHIVCCQYHGSVQGDPTGFCLPWVVHPKQTNKNLRCGNRKGLLSRNDQTHQRMGPAVIRIILWFRSAAAHALSNLFILDQLAWGPAVSVSLQASPGFHVVFQFQLGTLLDMANHIACLHVTMSETT